METTPCRRNQEVLPTRQMFLGIVPLTPGTMLAGSSSSSPFSLTAPSPTNRWGGGWPPCLGTATAVFTDKRHLTFPSVLHKLSLCHPLAPFPSSLTGLSPILSPPTLQLRHSLNTTSLMQPQQWWEWLQQPCRLIPVIPFPHTEPTCGPCSSMERLMLHSYHWTWGIKIVGDQRLRIRLWRGRTRRCPSHLWMKSWFTLNSKDEINWNQRANTSRTSRGWG